MPFTDLDRAGAQPGWYTARGAYAGAPEPYSWPAGSRTQIPRVVPGDGTSPVPQTGSAGSQAPEGTRTPLALRLAPYRRSRHPRPVPDSQFRLLPAGRPRHVPGVRDYDRIGPSAASRSRYEVSGGTRLACATGVTLPHSSPPCGLARCAPRSKPAGLTQVLRLHSPTDVDVGSALGSTVRWVSGATQGACRRGLLASHRNGHGCGGCGGAERALGSCV
jgi:hypothetical protein